MAFWSIILITFSHYLPGAFAKAVSFKTERIAAIHRLQAGATIANQSAEAFRRFTRWMVVEAFNC